MVAQLSRDLQTALKVTPTVTKLMVIALALIKLIILVIISSTLLIRRIKQNSSATSCKPVMRQKFGGSLTIP
jgi:hypothetical protein